MLHSKASQNKIIIVNGATYIKASDSILRQEELMPEFSHSLLKIMVLGSIVPLLFLYMFAHLIS
jgi:hypothetical protein